MSTSHSPHDIELLLARSRWMIRLACELCSDRAAAEDLVQDAWVAALEQPPRDEIPKRSWFARVLANSSRERHRRRASRRAREHDAARRESLPSAADIVERAEIARRLAECVLELDEPYRSTVLSRYFDELSGEEIARRDHVSSSTVRTRLARGLAMLRERLERRDGRAWMSSLVALAKFGSRSRVGTASTVGSSATAINLTGALAMSTFAKVGLGIAIIIGASVAWFASSSHAPNREPMRAATTVEPERSNESVTGSSAKPERTALVAPASPPISAPHPAQPAVAIADELTEEEIAKLETATPIGAIDGIVFVGRKPLEHGTAWCWASWDPLPARSLAASPIAGRDAKPSSLQHATIDQRGEFHFRALKSGQYRVGVDLGDGPRAETLVELKDAPGSRIVIVLGTAMVRGHVYDDDGKAVAGAWVELSRDVTRKGSSAFITGRRTDERGAYAIDRLAAGSYWFNVRLDGSNEGFRGDVMQRLPYLSIGEKRTLDFGEAKRASTWSGTVRTRGGEVVVGPATIWIDDKKTGAHFEHAYDEQGRFSIHVRPGTYSVRVGTPARPVELDAEAMTVKTSDVEQDIVIPGARLRGIVVDAETSHPWSSARPRVIVSIHREGANYPGAYLKTAVADDGRFVLDGLGAGAWMLDVYTSGYVPLLKDQRFTVLEGDFDVPLRVALRAP
jgi:RNA polymerase sigma factor (sigma-70 family)